MSVTLENIMKTMILICLLVFFTLVSKAQENKKPKYEEFNQDQLQLAFIKASKNVRTGKILTFAGAGAFSAGAILFISGMNDALVSDSDADVKVWGGFGLVLGGFVSTVIGVPVWIAGSTKKKKISLELVKFNPTGAASINGVGIKVSF
jgi:hypothetical protein